MRPDERNELHSAFDALTPDGESVERVRERLKAAPAAVPWVRVAAAVVAAAASVALVVWAVPRLPGNLPADSSTPSVTAVSTTSTSSAETTQPTSTAAISGTVASATTARETTVRTARTTTFAIAQDRTAVVRPKTTTKAAFTTQNPKQTTAVVEMFELTYSWDREGVRYTYDSKQGTLQCGEKSVDWRLPEQQLAEFGRLLSSVGIMTLPEDCRVPSDEGEFVYHCIRVKYGEQSHTVTCSGDAAAPESERLRQLMEACEYIEGVLTATDAIERLG